MILEIALGIVLAVVILALLPYVLVLSAYGLVAVIVIAVVAAVVNGLTQTQEGSALSMVLMAALLIGSVFWASRDFMHAKGKHQNARPPLAWAVRTLFLPDANSPRKLSRFWKGLAVGVVVAGLALSYAFVDPLEPTEALFVRAFGMLWIPLVAPMLCLNSVIFDLKSIAPESVSWARMEPVMLDKAAALHHRAWFWVGFFAGVALVTLCALVWFLSIGTR